MPKKQAAPAPLARGSRARSPRASYGGMSTRAVRVAGFEPVSSVYVLLLQGFLGHLGKARPLGPLELGLVVEPDDYPRIGADDALQDGTEERAGERVVV